MASQNFENHVRYYTPHHFVFYPLLLAAITGSVYEWNHHPDQATIWIFVVIIFVFIGWASYMMRQHYALGNQDRIVRMEMRFRYFVLTGKRLETLEAKLQFSQIAALRFASDEELPGLVDRAIRENLTAREIKKSIVNWQADTMRA